MPLKLRVKNASGISFDFPTNFTYGFIVTGLDGTVVWSRLQVTRLRPHVRRGSPGTVVFDEVHWAQRDLNCGPAQGRSVPCQGQPVSPGIYVVWGLVPPAAGLHNNAPVLQDSGPETLRATGWALTEPHELTLGGPRISCSEEIAADRDLHIEVLRDVRRRHRDLLSAIPGIQGVGVGNVRPSGLGIKLIVDTAQLGEGVSLADVVPATLEGCIVDTRHGRIVPASANGSD